MRAGVIIFPLLSNYTDLTDIVASSRIFAVRAQQPTDGPYIVYREISSIPLDTKGDSIDTAADPRLKQRSILDTTRVQISVFAETYVQLENIAVQVRNALDREWGAAEFPYANDISLDSCVFESAIDDYDDDYGSRGIYIKHLDFKLRLNQLPPPAPWTNTYSLDFDGIDDYLTLGDSDVFSFVNPSTLIDEPFTFSLWAKIDSLSQAPLFAKSAGVGNREYHCLLSSSDKLRIRLYDGTGLGGYIQSEVDAAITSTAWNHYAFTNTGGATGASGINIYVNGSLATQTKSASGIYSAMRNKAVELRVGTSEQNSFYLEGNIDEFAIFNVEKSASDILNIYNSGTPDDLSSDSGLIGYWRMGDPTGTSAYPTITDDSTNSNNGTMTNMISTDITADVP